MTRFRRGPVEWWEELLALAGGVVAGFVVFYAGRELLRREPLGRPRPRRTETEAADPDR